MALPESDSQGKSPKLHTSLSSVRRTCFAGSRNVNVRLVSAAMTLLGTILPKSEGFAVSRIVPGMLE